MSRRVLVLGATSAIAHAVCRRWAVGGDSFVLVARDAAKLSIVADDLRVLGAGELKTIAADLDRVEGHPLLIEHAAEFLGEIDFVLLAWGVLGDAVACRDDPRAVTSLLHTDLVAPASILTLIARRLERLGRGTIVVIGSVAGDRGRQSHYTYGSAKGGLALLLQGLRNRLHAAGVRVVTIKPGFVDTPMTAELPKNALFASPARIAAGIDRALRRGRDIAYVPWFWRPIMLVIRLLPEPLFKRLSL